MRKFIIFASFIFSSSLLPGSIASASENPLSVPNNKFGVHILFTSELEEAGRLVNSNGGDWGYVTIPIQSKEKDMEKWQKFMDEARSLHLIPIIRLATEGDYFDTKVWKKPKEEDILDFVNFLNSLNWPTKNRYIVVFNEPNRADEWGGEVNPSEYAKLLNYAVSVFKSKSFDFFVISAGMDNAAANTSFSMNEYEFLRQMNNSFPGIFSQIDGLGSHSYPNPAFSKPPQIQDNQSVGTFRFEKNLIQLFSQKNLPVFITETGWSRDKVSDNTAASYFEEAFKTVWTDENIVAVTPFLLRADHGPFVQFSLILNGERSETFKKIESLPKIKGTPLLNAEVLGQQVEKNISDVPIKDFSGKKDINKATIQVPSILKILFQKLVQN